MGRPHSGHGTVAIRSKDIARLRLSFGPPATSRSGPRHSGAPGSTAATFARQTDGNVRAYTEDLGDWRDLRGPRRWRRRDRHHPRKNPLDEPVAHDERR